MFSNLDDTELMIKIRERGFVIWITNQTTHTKILCYYWGFLKIKKFMITLYQNRSQFKSSIFPNTSIAFITDLYDNDKRDL